MKKLKIFIQNKNKEKIDQVGNFVPESGKFWSKAGIFFKMGDGSKSGNWRREMGGPFSTNSIENILTLQRVPNFVKLDDIPPLM